MDDDDLDVVINGGRVLVGIAARSLAAHATDATLPQLRALVLLRGRGALRLSELAAELDVDTSTATRLVDRLVRKGFIDRQVEQSDRRALRLSLTPAGRGLLRRMTEYRKRELREILSQLDPEERQHLRLAMAALSRVTGEAPEDAGPVAWDS
ncbi:DNA-binding MarR family transcriptional regulator [Motilibacter peucedani]|uniref:DNA-binding MarR family transcriptional regulator n=1 Tax=Motilibacter peucedani TaxID=598650 RepID=A0A420XQT0_9ACTN|nr:MarR family transcriptional regulator [Motilibacter peucedani]RKS75562.1 DNA-binding MarR family transcriptional regulator [Motilibacter peucedani]